MMLNCRRLLLHQCTLLIILALGCALLLMMATRTGSGLKLVQDMRSFYLPEATETPPHSHKTLPSDLIPAVPLRVPEATPPQLTPAVPSRAPEATPPQPQEESAAAGLVRIIHQSWKTNQLPARFHRWSLSFSSCQPNWQRKLWTDEDNEKLVAEHFAWFLPTYHKLSQSVQKADVSRLFYMYKFGGLYCDLDCECLNPFEHLLGNVSLAFGAMEGHTTGPQDGRYVDEGQIENSFMYSIPGHPFIMELIKQVEKSPHGSPEDTTGPYLIMRAIHRTRKSQAGFPKEFRGKKYLEIFPPSFFNPFSWISNRVPDCKDKGGFNRENEVKCREAHRNSSYILQYHTQVWLAGKPHLNKD